MIVPLQAANRLPLSSELPEPQLPDSHPLYAVFAYVSAAAARPGSTSMQPLTAIVVAKRTAMRRRRRVSILRA